MLSWIAATILITYSPSLVTAQQLSKPVYAVYVDALQTWWGDRVADEIGATDAKGYNVILLSFWIPYPDGSSNPQDAAIVWAQPERFFDLNMSKFGSTGSEIRANLAKAYHSNGAKVLVSAFGGTSFPTSAGIPATACGENLAQFVIDMQLDGVDLDYEDNDAMSAGTAVPWLIELMEAMLKKFKATGRRYIITNAPQAPYFMNKKYPKNYVDFHNSVLSDGSKVGDNIDSYLVQFYNQVSSTYDNYTTLFTRSNGWSLGTSVNEIAKKGIPLSKIAVGKPITTGDASNTGYVAATKLASIIRTARQPGNVWGSDEDVGGIMGWQFRSDRNGTWVSQLKTATGKINFEY